MPNRSALLMLLLFLEPILPGADLCTLRFPPLPAASWPATFGLPFARGSVTAPEQLQIVAGDGTLVPRQFRTVAHWPDGSLKWGLFDLMATPGQTCRVVVNDTASSAELPPPPLASQTDNATRIDTGPLQIEIPHTGPLLFRLQGTDIEPVQADLLQALQHQAPVPCTDENWIIDAGATPLTLTRSRAGADNSRQVSIEHNGPLRTTLRISGVMRSDDGTPTWPFILRLTAWRGRRMLKIQHTFIAGLPVENNFLRELSLRLDFPVDSATIAGQTRTLQQGDILSYTVLPQPIIHHLVPHQQKKPPQATLLWHHNGQAEPLPAGDQMATAAQAGKLSATLFDFKHLAPKEFAADHNGLSLFLWPKTGNRILDLRRRHGPPKPEYLEYNNPDGGFSTAKTHDIFLSWEDMPPETFADCANTLFFPQAGPDYYAATGALGDFLQRNHEYFPRIEATIDFIFKYFHRLRRDGRFDGMLDWGDLPLGAHGMSDHQNRSHPDASPFRGYTGWLNNDFELNFSYFLHFYRSDDLSVLRDGITATWHNLDVDTVHLDFPGTANRGLGRRHDQQHWGGGIVNYSYPTESAVMLYLLTGEQRPLDVLREVFASPHLHYGVYTALRLHEITGEQPYRERAEAWLRDDIRLERDMPFRAENFRVNSYDSIGYIFYDMLNPNPLLRDGAIKAAAWLQRRYLSPYLPKGFQTYGIFTLANKYAPTPENRQALAVQIKLLQQHLPETPDALAIADDAPMAQFDELNRRITRITNSAVISLQFLTSLPYALEQLRRADITEKQCLDFLYAWEEPESFSEILPTATIKPSPYPQWRNGWSVPVSHTSFPDWGLTPLLSPDALQQWQKAIQRYRLYEDGKLIGPGSFGHRYIMQNGRIGWSHRGSDILFSTSDNTNPAENGREYRVVFTAARDWTWQDTPSFTEQLDNTQILPYPDLSAPGRQWCAVVNHPSPEPVLIHPEPPELQKLSRAARERHAFTRNGLPVTTWERRQNLLVFTLPDDTDPRTSGQIFQFSYHSAP